MLVLAGTANVDVAVSESEPSIVAAAPVPADTLQATRVACVLDMLITDCVDNPLFPPESKASSSSSHICIVA